MLSPRIIPCLLISDGGLVKTQKFTSKKYVGDPINAIRIFNEKECDELMVLDIDSTTNDIKPNYEKIKKYAAECRMPLCYGGGINSRTGPSHHSIRSGKDSFIIWSNRKSSLDRKSCIRSWYSKRCCRP